ncbi:MAG: hypothetical protein IT171_08990 [Acidobacteria bacterium]|nr:hypothetical protein [Acidobacteriota bacterium]
MATLLQEFKSITESLNSAGIEYAVCGGWAMAIHGLPRSTKDIDLLILTDDLSRVLPLVRAQGFEIEGLPLHFDVEIRRNSKIDPLTKELVTIDLLLVNELMNDVWRSRKLLQWAEGEVVVVSREGLVKMKLLAGRKQDLLDIEKLREAEDES